MTRMLACDWSATVEECLYQEIPGPLATLSCVTAAGEHRREGHAPGFSVLLLDILIILSLCHFVVSAVSWLVSESAW